MQPQTNAQAQATRKTADGYARWIEDHKAELVADVRNLMPEAAEAWGAYIEWRASSKSTSIAAYFNRMVGRYIANRDQYQPVGEAS